MAREALGSALDQQTGSDREQRVYVRADGAVAYRDVMGVIARRPPEAPGASPQAGTGTANPAAIASWRAQLVAHLNRRKRFPPGASSGTASVRFTIGRGGQVLSASLAGSAGDAALDAEAEAEAMVRRASPVHPPTDGTGGGAITLRPRALLAMSDGPAWKRCDTSHATRSGEMTMRASRRMVIGAASLFGALVLPAAAQAPAPPAAKAIVETYARVGQAMYDDALSTARDLDRAVEALLAKPDDAALKAARDAWKAARVPYQQSEGLRFGNKVVDDWEGKVNAWPLDEGLIDYVDTTKYGETSDENPLFRANVIANTQLRVGRQVIDAKVIDRALLQKLHEAGGVEANVATGYHAIEFLLWGQDLNGTGPGAGNRPATDYALQGCTGGSCERRRTYLKVVTGLLVDDLAFQAKAWAPEGRARADLAKKGDNGSLAAILTGIGSLSYGELAGERMKLGLILHDPEEEHDCFSDNTHNSHWYNQVGMVALYTGRYQRPGGGVVEGPGLAALAAARAPEEAKRLDAAMAKASEALGAIKARADSGTEAYDQMIAEGNAEGNRLVQAGVDALIAQARAVEGVVAKLGLKIKLEGSDSLDDPKAVEKKK